MEEYFITFETYSGGHSLMSFPTTAEKTWNCKEGELDEMIERLAVNNHRVIRVIKGIPIPFENKLIIKPIGEN